MSYDQYAQLKLSSQNFTFQVNAVLIIIQQESCQLFTQMRNMMNTQTANIATIQLQTEIFV
jgi:hypothetical protein